MYFAKSDSLDQIRGEIRSLLLTGHLGQHLGLFLLQFSLPNPTFALEGFVILSFAGAKRAACASTVYWMRSSH
ncbi:MAG: hypothetical protein JWR60_3073 [Polaromonas sp.]|nr:hypothetical protein [Polaromonas sp.]